MKNKLWPSVTIILALLSTFSFYTLRKLRIENEAISWKLQSYVNDYSEMIENHELKTLSPLFFRNKHVNPYGFLETWNDSTIYIRIHDSICLPCSTTILDKIIYSYANSKQFKLHVLGSYKMNHNFLGDLKKLGLDQITHTNSADELGFIEADSLNVPYLFTISNSKISTLFILSATKDTEIEAYFSMVNRLLGK